MPRPNVGNPGNRGGGRKGYEYETEQLKKMSSHVNWLFAYIDAVRRGQATENQHKVFERLEKVLLKELDKLHANKQHSNVELELPQNLIDILYGKNRGTINEDTE